MCVIRRYISNRLNVKRRPSRYRRPVQQLQWLHMAWMPTLWHAVHENIKSGAIETDLTLGQPKVSRHHAKIRHEIVAHHGCERIPFCLAIDTLKRSAQQALVANSW